MKNSFYKIASLIFFSLLISDKIVASESIFFDGNLTEAREKAKKENKVLLLDFTASWCLPCRWMEKTVYNDQSVKDFANKNVVIIKINVDDFDGITLKDAYKVNLLPTTILFSPNGKTLSRKEESIGTDAWIEWLQSEMKKNNIVAKTIVEIPNSQINQKANNATTNNESVDESVIEEIIRREELNPDDIEDKMVIPMNYYIQTGLFKKFENAVKYAENLDDKLSQNTSIIALDHKSETVYQIALGGFATFEEANLFNDFLKSLNIKGIIKKHE